jgi:hypothetical protein
MKIGIIEFNSCHSETLLSWIEYINNKNYNYNIFVKNKKNNWLDYYNSLINFRSKILLINNLDFMIDEYDILFINTSHIVDTNNDLFKKMIEYNKKIIFIHHYDKPLFKNTINNIIVTPLLKKYIKKKTKSDIINYILPIFKFKKISKEEFKYLFCFIGNMRHRNLINFEKILELSINYNFKILYIGNNFGLENFNLNKYKNFVHFSNLNSIDFIEKLSYVKYLLPIVNTKKCYSKKRLTGIIPLGINFNIPLIINSIIANIYNFNNLNSIIYNDKNFVEIIIKIINKEYDYISLKNNLSKMNEKIIKNNNEILDNIIYKIKNFRPIY